MTRQQLIEQITRQVYGTQASDDASITPNYVNQLINQGIGLMAKQSYKDNIQLDGIGYVNNSFYTTFKNLSVTLDDNFTWKVTLPQIPFSIGRNEGVSTLRFKNSEGNVSLPVIWLSENQVGYYQTMPQIPGKVLAYYQNDEIYILTTLILNGYSATATIVSGGDSSNLTSNLNVPDDYIPGIVDYVTKILMMARMQVQDNANDGTDAIKTV